MSGELFAVGKIIGCFGVHGYVKIEPLTHRIGRFRDLDEVLRGKTPDAVVADTVVDVHVGDSKVRVRLASAQDRTAAEALVGEYLFVTKNHLDPPARGSWFVHDIVDCLVVTPEGKDVGNVIEVIPGSGNDIWVIRTQGGESLIPAISEFVLHVDVVKRRIVVKLIEGLVEGL